MNVQDLERLARNEERLMETQKINRIRDIPDFPFGSLDDLRAAKTLGQITFGTEYRPELVDAFGTGGDILAHYFWLSWPPLIGIGFVVAAFLTGRFVLFWGVI